MALTEAERLKRIASLISPCPPLNVWDGFDLCPNDGGILPPEVESSSTRGWATNTGCSGKSIRSWGYPMRRSLARPRFSALALSLGMLLAAALTLAGGLKVSQAVQSEFAQGSNAKPTVLAEGAHGLRKPLEP
ncbi:hypothetical protein ETD86_40445 [Nonomuraea turkmeniaca]|uniref:Uncharacterized protein n=1 Tax=Nonomuraea turkmeniaca TaxID=103838 RepID=A0A5S4FM66_9ACTN|nr:hypothetical protein [Nonomuraea turkmeniaca]TMR10247.1 hypothetical protein ETD86_40445 [Nonomuraea turkmeniaca]